MGLSDSGSYALIFCITFVLVAAITVVTAKVFDKTPSLPGTQPFDNGAPPFPDAVPQIPPPPGTSGTKCVNFCTSEKTGALEPCGSTALVTCAGDAECAPCQDNQPYKNIQCLDASAWPHVKAQQAALKNESPKYCLPKPVACLDATSLKECRVTDDCAMCTETSSLPNKETFQCKMLRGGQVLRVNGQEITVKDSGQYCVPSFSGCDPKYGIATWTSNEGWTCRCKYPGIYGGKQCNELVACNADMVTPWSAQKQQLLLNVPGKDGSKVGEPWTVESGVDPNKCLAPDGTQVECTTAGMPRTVACQCDGIQKGTLASYTYATNNPLTCEVDPCYGTPAGGKTWLWDATPGTNKDQLPSIPRQPPTTCSCSGFGSSAWRFQAKSNPSSNDYTWQGYCKDVHIPQSNIVLPADGSKEFCDAQKQANTDAMGTALVPGKRGGTSICATDPCTGVFGDTGYRVNLGELSALGHFNAATGQCDCATTPEGSTAVLLQDAQCDRSINPVCAYCVNACISPPGTTKNEEKPCPVAPGSNCGKNVTCATLQDGSKTCKCGEGCRYYDGQCHSIRENKACCEDGYHGVDMGEGMNICGHASKASCKLVRSVKSCNGPDVNWHEMAMVCSGDDVCGYCITGDPTSCKGPSRQSFRDNCGINRDGSHR